MKLPFRGAVDCDIHPAAPPITALLPYMSEYWREQIRNRYIDRFGFAMTSNNPLLPIHGRPDWKPKGGVPGSDLGLLRTRLSTRSARRMRSATSCTVRWPFIMAIWPRPS